MKWQCDGEWEGGGRRTRQKYAKHENKLFIHKLVNWKVVVWMCARSRVDCCFVWKWKILCFFISFTETTSKRGPGVRWPIVWNQQGTIQKTWSVWTFGFSGEKNFWFRECRTLRSTEDRKWDMETIVLRARNLFGTEYCWKGNFSLFKVIKFSLRTH